MTNDELDALEKRAWLDLVEKPDRTSPADYPNMALITEEELGGYTRDAIASLQSQLAAEKARADEVSVQAHGYVIELDAIYAALGTADAEGAPEAAVSIRGLFAELDQLMGRFNDVCAELNDARSERDATLAEVLELRNIVSKCAEALDNGAAISPDCTVEFMQSLPSEIGLHVASIVEDRDQSKEHADAALAENRELRELLDGARDIVEHYADDLVSASVEKETRAFLARIDAKLTKKDTP